MRVLSIVNIKGGVAKTATAVNMAYNFATTHKKRVLLIDMDSQGHASMFCDVRDYDRPSVADVLTQAHYPIANAIRKNCFCGVTMDVLPADMRLVKANRELLIATERGTKRLAIALRSIADDYDFVIIDHAPHVDMAMVGGLVASDDVIVPVTLDEFATDGLCILTERVEEIRGEYNPRLCIVGCFAARYYKNNAGDAALQDIVASGMPLFETVVRRTCRVPESEAKRMPLNMFAPNSTAARDYEYLCCEYLKKVSKADTKGGF